jgi:predicted ATP-binding protein involved in virulence
LPLILYIGTEYVHQQKAVTDTLEENGTAKQGYWYCLDDKSMQSYVFSWYEKLYLTQREQTQSNAAKEYYGNIPNNTLTAFKLALQALLPDITDLNWIKNTLSKQEKYVLVFHIANEGWRTYDMLSDGYRYLVLLIGELITRATLLNKHLGVEVACQIRGVVLIDEFGIHLHPSIQSDILSRLAAIFPKVQFVVTTHSPLLVNGLHKEQIHLISQETDRTRIAANPDDDVIGMGAEGILTELFGLPTTLDATAIAYRTEYIALFQKYTLGTITQTEKERFAQLKNKLAEYGLQNAISDDPIVEMVRTELNNLTNNTTRAVIPKEDLQTQVRNILANHIKQK